MSGVNKVIIIGRLGQDPDVRHLPIGTQVTNLSIATSESWKDKGTGEQKEKTEWHRVVFFGRQAEIAAEYLRKGSQVYIEGQLRTRKWQDSDGNDRWTTEINGRFMQMLGGRQDNARSEPASAGPKQQPQQPATEKTQDDDLDDDIPF